MPVLFIILIDGKEGSLVRYRLLLQILNQAVRHTDIVVFRSPVQQVLLGMKHEYQIAPLRSIHPVRRDADFHHIRLIPGCSHCNGF